MLWSIGQSTAMCCGKEKKKKQIYFEMFLQETLNNTLITQQLSLGIDCDCCGLQLGEILSTLILQFIEPKRINYVYLLILKWSCAPK